MITRELMQVLENNGKQELWFQFQNGRGLPAGYHFTEVKSIRVDSVDCGGTADAWTETVIQLWLPAAASMERPMSASKALGILKKVDSIRPIGSEAPCRFEAENESGDTVIYDIEAAEVNTQGVTIHLASQKTQCKAQKRDATACGGSAEGTSEESGCGSTQKAKTGTCC